MLVDNCIYCINYNPTAILSTHTGKVHHSKILLQLEVPGGALPYSHPEKQISKLFCFSPKCVFEMDLVTHYYG